MNCYILNNPPTSYDIIIIGGGLAGLCSAIHLSKEGKNVLLIEKHEYPRHKVCGEYISNEVLPYLNYLGLDPFSMGAVKIDRFSISSATNKVMSTSLPLGGFGISRYTLDAQLAKRAVDEGTKILHETVVEVEYDNDLFTVKDRSGNQYQSRVVIGAYGKRDTLDKKLNRDFIQNKSPYLGIKMHVEGEFPSNLVSLHNFEGGYCGVSKVEDDRINLCYIVDYERFKKYKDIEEFQHQVMFKNDALRKIFGESQNLLDRPITISQISFDQKKPVVDHIIMCGDTAGMIHPLCGNGMSMAIQSAQMATQPIILYLNGNIKSRSIMENHYRMAWNKAFNSRLKVGHLTSKLLSNNLISNFGIYVLRPFPYILRKIIALTHGKPMKIE